MAVLERVSIGSLAQGAVPPGYTFTRSTAALYVDSDGLLKWSAHNLLLRSEEFDNASWTKGAGASVSANTVTAPDGTLTGDSLVASGSPGSVYQTAVGLTPATIYTASAYVKYSNVQWVRFMYYDGGGNQCRVWVDVQNGVIGTGNTAGTGTFTAATIVPAGSGWYRISVTGTQPAVNGLVQLQPVTADASTTTAAGTVYMWGAQLNYGSTATAYLPTTSAARYDSPRRQWDATNRRWGYVGEGSRTNLLLRSILPGGGSPPTSWTVGAGSGTATASIYGTVDGASAYSFTSSASRNIFAQIVTTANNTTYQHSCYVESVTGSVAIRDVLLVTSLPSGCSIVAYRQDGVAITSTTAVTVGRVSIEIGGTYTGAATEFRIGCGCSANATGTVVLSRPQLEAAPAPSSYIPTTTVAVTRGADLLTRALTGPEGTALSTQGTMVVEFSFLGGGSTAGPDSRVAISLDGGVSTERVIIFNNTSAVGSIVSDSVLQSTILVSGEAAVGAVQKCAVTWELNDVQFARNGSHGTRDGSATMPTLTAVAIGAQSNAQFPGNVLVYGWTIYDDHYPTDAGMDALTTPTTTRNQSRLTLGLGLGL